MLSLREISKSYGGQLLFDHVNFQMTEGERLGLVGRNGYGKSTLFRIILGEEEPDEGEVQVPKNYKIGYLAQHLRFHEKTLIDEACLGLPEDEKDQRYQAEKILMGLGFTKDDFELPPQSFSGGYQIRLSLTKVLVSKPNLLLLDEPTNYLDILSIRWLSQFLRSWRNEMIIISHDREFMDQVTTHTAMIHRRQLKKIKGGTEKIYTQILQEEETHEKTRLNEEKKRKQEEAFINRFRAQAAKASAVQSRVKRLEKLPVLEKLSQVDELDFEFRYSSFFADFMVRVKDVSFGYEIQNPLIENLNLTVQPKARIGIIGKNGKGKSTLLNLIAGEIKPLSGEITMHPNVKVGYFGQTNIQRLHQNHTIEEEVQNENPNLTRTAVRNICGTMMFSGSQAEKKISILSGGEKSRVLLGKILAHPSNLLLLDEPTNHLDMESIEALIESLQNFEGAVMIVTHSEMILRAFATELVIFQKGKVENFKGGYDEFLENIGWEEETENIPSKRKESGGNKKELRRQRAEQVSERSRLLAPIKKRIKEVESEIQSSEKEKKNFEADIVRASQSRQVLKVAELSKQLKFLQINLDAFYEELEELMKKEEKLQGMEG